MNEPRIFFGSNIKFLRERKKLSQEALAKKLFVTRAKLVAIETGQTRSPQPEDFVRFSDFFGISVDSLLRIELPKLGELKLRELEAGNDVYVKGGNLRVLAITVDKSNKENVEYVPVKAKAGYSAGYNDAEFIASLPKFSLPNLPQGGTYRVFPITGDSMLPIPSGSDVTGKYITDWKSIKTRTPCIIILKDQDMVFKLVTVDEYNIVLESENPMYEPYTVSFDEVLELWQFYSFTSREMPEPQTDMSQLMRMMHELKDQISTIRSQSRW